MDKFLILDFLKSDLLRYKHLIDIDYKYDWKIWFGIFSPRFIPVLLCRISYYLYTKKLSVVAKFFSLINFFFFGIEISVRCRIGRGIFFPHTQGTVIGAESIGENCTIFQGVTIGAKEMDLIYSAERRPSLGDNVILGAGAKILGGIFLGNGVIVGANSVVLKTVDENIMVAGIPAKTIKEL